MILRRTASALTIAFGLHLAHAEEIAPLPLQALDLEFENEYRRGAAKLEQGYRDALASLAADYKSRGHLDGLLAIETELEALDAAAETASDERDEAIILGASTAEPTGRMQFAPAHHLLVKCQPGSIAAWRINDVPSGSYHVFVHGYAGPFAGGKFRVTAGSAATEASVETGDRWSRARVFPAGRLSIDEGVRTLELTVLEARGLGLLELISVELRPVQP